MVTAGQRRTKKVISANNGASTNADVVNTFRNGVGFAAKYRLLGSSVVFFVARFTMHNTVYRKTDYCIQRAGARRVGALNTVVTLAVGTSKFRSIIKPFL